MGESAAVSRDVRGIDGTRRQRRDVTRPVGYELAAAKSGRERQRWDTAGPAGSIAEMQEEPTGGVAGMREEPAGGGGERREVGGDKLQAPGGTSEAGGGDEKVERERNWWEAAAGGGGKRQAAAGHGNWRRHRRDTAAREGRQQRDAARPAEESCRRRQRAVGKGRPTAASTETGEADGDWEAPRCWRQKAATSGETSLLGRRR